MLQVDVVRYARAFSLHNPAIQLTMRSMVLQSYEVIIVSKAFEKLPTFKRHKMGELNHLCSSRLPVQYS